jgi:Carboxypeptidase regulatory-like domain
MPPASTHEHDCRVLETKDHRIHIKPDRTTDTRLGFFTILFLLIFSGLTCAAALAQQSFSSSSDKVLPDAPQPAGITRPSGETDSQHMGAGTISGTVLDTNRDVVQGAQVTAAGQSGSAIRILESGSNGQFAFADLPAIFISLR